MTGRELRSAIKNLCDPKKTLAPTNPRVIDLDEAGHGQIRGTRWREDLRERLDPTLESDEPVFFTGLRGAGKTTELLRARDDLRSDGYFAVCADLGEYLSLSDPVALSDVLTMLVYAVEREVLTLEGREEDVAGHEGFLRRVWTGLTGTEATPKEFEATLGLAGTSGKMKFELRTRPEPRQRIREMVARSLSRYIELVRAEVLMLDSRVRAQGKRGLVILADGLEKFNSSHETWDALSKSVIHLFTQQVEQLQLPVRVLYTIPPWVALRVRVDRLMQLPMIKLRDKSGDEFALGFESAKKLITARVPEAMLRTLLGGDRFEHRVHRMISESGGYLRELLQIVTEVASEPRALDDDAFEKRLSNVAQGVHSATTDRREHALLARVHLEKTLIVDDDSERSRLEHLIAQNMILYYSNSDRWYDIHPALLSHRSVRDELAKLRSS
jgi:hypothetical protein